MNKKDSVQKALDNFKWDKEKRFYALDILELCALAETLELPDQINDSYTYGFIKGMRYMKAQQKKAAKAGGING